LFDSEIELDWSEDIAKVVEFGFGGFVDEDVELGAVGLGGESGGEAAYCVRHGC